MFASDTIKRDAAEQCLRRASKAIVEFDLIRLETKDATMNGLFTCIGEETLLDRMDSDVLFSLVGLYRRYLYRAVVAEERQRRISSQDG